MFVMEQQESRCRRGLLSTDRPWLPGRVSGPGVHVVKPLFPMRVDNGTHNNNNNGTVSYYCFLRTALPPAYTLYSYERYYSQEQSEYTCILQRQRQHSTPPPPRRRCSPPAPPGPSSAASSSAARTTPRHRRPAGKPPRSRPPARGTGGPASPCTRSPSGRCVCPGGSIGSMGREEKGRGDVYTYLHLPHIVRTSKNTTMVVVRLENERGSRC